MRPRTTARCLGPLVLLALSFPAPANAYPRPGITERVSVASDGAEANAASFSPDISADGRYVAFYSAASNLVPGDTNGANDVFAHDRATGVTERVSVASDGAESNASSFDPVISADGRHFAFHGAASNLVPGDTNGAWDVFAHDRATGITERVSVASDGAEANAISFASSISADGRYVAFTSRASNLVPGDTNGAPDAFVHDRATGTTERVSVGSDGDEGNHHSFAPAISADGQHVAFQSSASNLVPGDTNGGGFVYDVFVHDRATRATERVSVTSDGAEANSSSFDPSISADGRYIAFSGLASNLVPRDTNGERDAFVHDRVTGTTERVNVASDGAEANSHSFYSAISADGRYVAFWSWATNLVPGDTNVAYDVFVHDRATGVTERVSVASDGDEADAHTYQPAVSATGRHVAFWSHASNLVPGDTNGNQDVFVHDRGGSLGVVGSPSVVKAPGGVAVSGQVTFSGATLVEATDPDDDGTDIGPPEAAGAGAELTGAALIYRPELEDLLIRLDLAELPPNGAPATVYGLSFEVGGERFEVRGTAPTRSSPCGLPQDACEVSSVPTTAEFALYHCDIICTRTAVLGGAVGTAGHEVWMVLPEEISPVRPGAEFVDLSAFTGIGTQVSGSFDILDEVPLASSVIPAAQVELGIADASRPEDEVVFTVEADLLAGDFSGTIPSTGLSPASYRVWARACLGDVCGPAAVAPVTLGEVVGQQDTNLDLTVAGRGQDLALRARLTVLDPPSEGIAGRTIGFFSDGELIGSAQTDDDGDAAVAVPPGHRGANRTYEAVFAGDDLYRASSDERPGQGGDQGDRSGSFGHQAPVGGVMLL